eukprot:PRCOL_00000911-RA
MPRTKKEQVAECTVPQPKRARSAYSFFVAEQRPIVANKHKELKTHEIFKKVAEEWKKITDKQKQKYQKLADDDKVRFTEEEGVWKAAGGVKKSKKQKKNKKAKDPNAPKRPQTAFFAFAAANRPKLLEANPELKGKVTQITTLLGERWRSLTDEEKKPFVKAAIQDKARYEKQMATYVKPQ